MVSLRLNSTAKKDRMPILKGGQKNSDQIKKKLLGRRNSKCLLTRRIPIRNNRAQMTYFPVDKLYA